MARTTFYSDFGGTTVRLVNIEPMKNAEFAARFPGFKGRRYDSFAMKVGRPEGAVPVYDQVAKRWVCDLLPLTRTVEFKSNPSMHKCSARCTNATGHQCECQCGGKNHGAGNFRCV